MLKGAGIHQMFAWKPIYKGDFAGAAVYQVPLAGLDMDRTHKIIFKTVATESVLLKVNNDGGANYSDAYHYAGRAGGAGAHAYTQGAAVAFITCNPGAKSLAELMFNKHDSKLFLQGHATYWFNADNFRIIDLVAFYNQAGPYTTFDFYTNLASNFTLQVQIFESVFGF